jgi:hypothetical protein
MLTFNPIAFIIFIILAAITVFVDRKWAPFPILIAVCYFTIAQGIQIGPFNFNVIRLFIAVGFFRVVIKNEINMVAIVRQDINFIIWGLIAILASMFHNNVEDALVYRMGIVYDIFGIYYLIRCFCKNLSDLEQLVKILALLLLPISLCMVYEKISDYNIFSILGGVAENSLIRDDKVRAQGPFLHAILAGTVGSVTIPLFIGIFKLHKREAIIGIASGIIMVVTSTSSGPLMGTIVGVMALLFWKKRDLVKYLPAIFVLAYLFLGIIMKDPPYYVISKFDLTGSSTGWHRARLIESSLEHFDEWWFAGTDYTRHWMASGVSWSQEHTDITNYYIKMGVLGGISLMIMLVAIFVTCFRYIGRLMNYYSTDNKQKFMIWAIGSSLFTHAVTCLSVSYFDQSYVFLYLIIGAVSSLYAVNIVQKK